MKLERIEWNEEAAGLLALAFQKIAGPDVGEIRQEVAGGRVDLWGISRPGELVAVVVSRWIAPGKFWIEWAAGGAPKGPIYGAALSALEDAARQLGAVEIGALAIRQSAALQLIRGGYRWRNGEFWKAL